jgi:hypothetical protein
MDANQAPVEKELAQAHALRAAGNEGRARVCARRAAGIALREWYKRRLGSGWHGDAVKQLQRLQADAFAPGKVREAARRLTTRVDFDHTLPFEDDPLEDARGSVEFVSQREK